MYRLFNWIKNHKLTFILLLIVIYFIYSKFFSTARSRQFSQFSPSQGSVSAPMTGFEARQTSKLGFAAPAMPDIMPPYEAPPTTDVANRMVISESYLSLLVKDVRASLNQIIQTVESMGGYMVTSYLNNPQDAPTATLTVRVPSDQLQSALEQFRGLAVKVVSENLSGQDVTDEYVDNQARLETLEKTKAKFEEIFDKATRIEDILNVQQQIINLQSQIDAVIGQQNYLEKNAQMARLTIYLSTDELALPYAPSETWRPEVIFRQAVRSLIGHLRRLGTALIWLAVYSIVLIPTLLLVRYFMRKVKNGQVL